MSPPKSQKELFEFYYEYVKPLYSETQLTNALPSEVLFEIHAAFDHLSRISYYREPARVALEKAYSHLKRSCLDLCKLKYKQTRDEYDELKGVDLALVNNGEFEGEMMRAFEEIRIAALEARRSEGDNLGPSGHEGAFDHWYPVYRSCVAFQRDYYRHPAIPWARKAVRRHRWQSRTEQLVISFLAGIVATFVFQQIYSMISGA